MASFGTLGKNDKKARIYTYVLLAVYVFILMLFCTKSSPIYIFNDWFDANAYMTMGKGLVRGAVLYKDLFDHKGPLLYFLYAIGYLIDHTGFTGIFIIQVISMYLVSLFSFKTAKVYTKSGILSAAAALLAPMTVLTSRIYVYGRDYGGGSPDEFTAPLFVISIYLAVKLLKDRECGEKDCPKLFWLGVAGGLIFLLKFNFFVFTVGLMLPLFAVLVFKDIKKFFVYALYTFLGFAVTFVPYGIYALATGSVRDFIDVYLLFNLSYAGESEGILFGIPSSLKNVWDCLWGAFTGHEYIALLSLAAALLGMIYFIIKDKENRLLNVSLLLSFLFTAAILGRKLMIYAIVPLMVFSLMGFLALCDILKERGLRFDNPPKGAAKRILAFAAAAFTLFFSIINNNLVSGDLNRFKKTEDGKERLCQDELAEVLLQQPEEDRTLLLVLALDAGFYTRLDIVPSSKYFYRPNISFTAYPDIYIGQYEDVKNKVNNYVVAEFEAVYDADSANEAINAYNYRKKIGTAINMNYDLVKVVKGTNLQHSKTYYLYRKKL